MTFRLIILMISISSFSTAVHIQCHYVLITPSIIGTQYTCYGVCISPNQGSTVTGVNGVHMKGKGDKDVTAIMLDDCDELTKIPQSIEKFFPNMVAFRIMRTKIANLNKEDFKNYGKLKSLTIVNNELLEKLPGDLFEYMPNLQKINFNQNSIKIVGDKILYPITNLKFASFVGNKCINEIANRPEQFAFLEGFLKIYCSDDDYPCSTINIEDRVCNLGESNVHMLKASDEYENMYREIQNNLMAYKNKCKCKEL